MAAPAKGAAWYTYQKAIDELVELMLEDDGNIAEAKLDINNAPADTKRLAWNASAGKMEWVTKEAAANDTGEIRISASDSMDYLGQKILSGAMDFQLFAAQIM